MGYNTLETKEVERNGESFSFIKTQGEGSQSRPNWGIVIKPGDIEGSRLGKWLGASGSDFLQRAFRKQFTIMYHHTRLGTNDDLFFEKLGQDNMVTQTASGKSNKKLKEAQLQISNLRKMLESRGASEEEIEEAISGTHKYID